MRPAPRYLSQKRPIASARVGRTRPELAAELVRLEYERTRLERSLASLDGRRETVTQQLATIRDRAGWIQDRLSADDIPDEVPAPAQARAPAPPAAARPAPPAPRTPTLKRRPRG